MNKLLLIIMPLFLWMAGCAKEEPAFLRINTISVTEKEFEDSFRLSSYYQDKKEGRQRFLETFIAKKLMLAEAEKRGLDKDPRLLFDLQIFWEQALMKKLLQEKSKEIARRIQVTDQQARQYYQSAKETAFAGKPFSEVRETIKQILMQQQQSRQMRQWINELRKRAVVFMDNQFIPPQEVSHDSL